MATTTTTPYGTYTHGVPEHRGFGSYDRTDTWVPHHPPDAPGADRFACASKDDDTPGWFGPYNAQCPCCWLNHGHTTAYHAAHTKGTP